MRKVCFLVALLLVCALFPQSSFSQILVVIVEPCPDDDANAGMLLTSALIATWITVSGKTFGSSMLRGVAFICGGVIVFSEFETESSGCVTFTGVVAVGSILGGGIGLILTLIKHSGSPVSPKVSPSWRPDDILPYSRLPSIPQWDLGVYRRGLKLTYRF